MSDRVGVFRDGSIVQLGTPDALYNSPADAFVASFIGDNNLFDGVVERIEGDTCRVRLEGGLSVIACPKQLDGNGSVRLAVRPECIRLGDAAAENSFLARLEGRIYLGDHQQLLVRLPNGQPVAVKTEAALSTTPGQSVTLNWAAADCWAFPAASGDNHTAKRKEQGG